MRNLLVIILLMLAIPSAAARQDGAWSTIVDGVRGRLSIEFTTPVASCDIAVVYLELQNVSESISPIEISYESSSGFRWQLKDDFGTLVPKPDVIVASIISLSPYRLTLPHDSTLRLRVSVSGYGLKPSGGIALQLPRDFWQFHFDSARLYLLERTFTAKPDRDLKHRTWSGSLILPAVAILSPKG